MSESVSTPTVPDELTPLLDNSLVQAAQDYWETTSLEALHRIMPQPTTVTFGRDGSGRAVEIEPLGEWDETTMVVGTPYQQAWKPSMFVRMDYAHMAVNPNSRMVVLPNNSVTDQYIDLSGSQLEAVSNGNLRPLFEQQLRVLESLGVRGEVTLSGYSLGALTAIGLAAVCSDKFNVSSLNADEPPTGERDPKILQKDFLASGGWGDQKAAIEDTQLPVLSQALNTRRMGMDYLRFMVASLDPCSKAVRQGMARHNFAELLKSARDQWPTIPIKVGQVAGSRLVRVEQVPTDIVALRQYSGPGARKHATGDNVVAHSLMILDALRATQQNESEL